MRTGEIDMSLDISPFLGLPENSSFKNILIKNSALQYFLYNQHCILPRKLLGLRLFKIPSVPIAEQILMYSNNRSF